MKGREVLKVNRNLSLDELETFMNENWDRAEYGDFRRGRPTPASIEEYIMLPSTAHCLTIAYTRKDKVILTVADNPDGVRRVAFSAVPTNNIFTSVMQDAAIIARTKEMKGPAHEINRFYAKHMEELLREKGLI